MWRSHREGGRHALGFLNRVGWTADLPDEARRALAGVTQQVRIKRNKPAAFEGQAIIRSGVAAMEVGTADGRQVLSELRSRGDMLHGADGARAHSELSLLVVPDDAWLLLCARHAAINAAVQGHQRALLGRLHQRVAWMSLRGAHARVLAMLLHLAELHGVPDARGLIVNLALTHREMAMLVGATRETVSVALGALRDAGVVCTERRRVVLTDLHRARAIAAGAAIDEAQTVRMVG